VSGFDVLKEEYSFIFRRDEFGFSVHILFELNLSILDIIINVLIDPHPISREVSQLQLPEK